MLQDLRPNSLSAEKVSNRIGEQARDALVRFVGEFFHLLPKGRIDLGADLY
jgi:hypothetical protein